MKKQIVLIGIMVMMSVSACAETVDNQGLPTRVELPTDDMVLVNPPIDLAQTTLTPTQSISSVAQLPASWTPTETPTKTFTPSVTPSATITDTPSPTPSITFTPTPTPTETLESAPLLSLAELAARITNLPPTFDIPPGYFQPNPTPITFGTSPTNCTILPAGGFASALQADSGLGASLGCPSGAVISLQSATQMYERGSMIWVNESGGLIYVLYGNGTFQRFPDTFIAGQDPDSGGEMPPAGLIEPVRGFGKVWRTMMGVRDGVGWGVTPEMGDTATIQEFATGRLIYLPTRGNILALTYSGSPNSGTWRVVLGTY